MLLNIKQIRTHCLKKSLYCGKEEIHSKIELIIYQLKWYSLTNIISLMLWVLCPKLVLLLTVIFQYRPCLKNMTSFIPPRYQKSRGMSHYTTEMYTYSNFRCTCMHTHTYIYTWIYIYIQTNTYTYTYIYIYIYRSFKHVSLNSKGIFCLYNSIKIIWVSW